jgi:Pyridoxamine 5'-phosphate oxidase like
MSDHEHIDRIWAIIEKVGVCMLTTRFDVGMRARPLEARPDRASNRLLFMTDAHSPKREEMVRWPEVCLTFIDTPKKPTSQSAAQRGLWTTTLSCVLSRGLRTTWCGGQEAQTIPTPVSSWSSQQ